MQTLIGLAILVLLAFVASSRRFWSLRRYPAGAVWLTGGFLAVLTGLLLGPHGPIPGGMFSRPQIDLLSPLTYFCLGWVGMIVGLQAHRRLQHMVPPRGGLHRLLLGGHQGGLRLGRCTAHSSRGFEVAGG